MIGALAGRVQATLGPEPEPGGYESLRRGLQIIGVVQDAGRITVAELAAAVGLPLSTVYRYAATLRETGFIVDDDGHLVPGTRMAERSDENAHLINVAKPVLHRLRAATDLTVLMLIRVHTMALCLDWAPSRRRHRIFFRPGQVRPIAAGGSALPLLAFAPPPIVRAVLQRPVRGTTTASPTVQELTTLLSRIRAEGISVSRGHITPGLTSIGVPVMVADRCLCALSLVGEDDELPPGLIDRRVEQTRRAAARIAATLPAAIASEDWSNADG